MNLKRWLSLCLAALLLCGSMPLAAAADSLPDAGAGRKITAEEFSQSIRAETGLSLSLSGSTVTREAAASALAGSLGITTEGQASYTDTAALSDSARAAVSVLSKAGVFFGYSDGTFRPEKELTVSEAEKIAARVRGILSTDYTDGIVQTTRFGSVIGFENEDDGAYTWLNVPYGKSPVGDLRWRAPEFPDAWDGVRETKETGECGIQMSNGKVISSEDCLNLDIYRPNNGGTNLPVHVFIHGGNNQTGSSDSLDGGLLASMENCVVVCPNFRLGALGFNCLPALKTGNQLEDSGNYTMLDIALALDWVKENIASFGGDGGNITVSGLSSGGRDVMAMLISPIFKGKFQKAISFSGGMTTSDPEDAVKVYANAFSALVVEDGVKSTAEEAYAWLLTDGQDVRDYLYGLPAERIAPLMAGADIRMAPFPHLFEDGYVLPEGGFSANRYASDVPVMMFSASNEFSLFGLRAAHIKDRIADGTVYTDPATKAEAAFICKYGGLLYGLFNAEESAERMIGHYDGEIYTCWIEWGNDPAIVGEKMATERGSAHGINLPIMSGGKLLNIAATYPEPFQTAGFLDLSHTFMRYMGNFMRTGNPNGEGLVEWDKWTAADSGPTHLVFDADRNQAIIQMTDARIVYEDVLAQMDADTTISEEAKKDIVTTNFNGRWFSARLDEHYGNPSLWPE